MNYKEIIAEKFKSLQDHICSELEKLEINISFKEDLWDRAEGGGGRSRIITNGNVFEKGGVNFSAVHGPTPTKILNALDIKEADFYATGVSIVIHPKNPFVPIIHMNVRYFEMTNGIWWFGGGIDLTPAYVNPKEGRDFHRSLKDVCDIFIPEVYETYKNNADEYFYIKHRKETRGIGGIFFDHLHTQSTNKSKEEIEQFVLNLGNLFPEVYTKIVEANKNTSYTKKNKEWQSVRRSRYVEFNLVYDKGTKFGLDTDGRIESILMSMPPYAEWHYNYKPEPGSDEEKSIRYFAKEINWITL